MNDVITSFLQEHLRFRHKPTLSSRIYIVCRGISQVCLAHIRNTLSIKSILLNTSKQGLEVATMQPLDTQLVPLERHNNALNLNGRHMARVSS